MASTNFIKGNTKEGYPFGPLPESVSLRVGALRDARTVLRLPNLHIEKAVQDSERPALNSNPPAAEVISRPAIAESSVDAITTQPALEIETPKIDPVVYGKPLNADTIRQTFDEIYGGSQN